MADPNADNAALAVDELKRKARRRLIGAVVLALAAATLLPLLLEQEQKPLGDDVSVQIPPVDDGKFVTRLNGGDKANAAPPGPKADARAEGRIETRPEAKGDAKVEPKADGSAAPKVEPKSVAKAEATADATAGAKAGAKAEAKPEPKADVKADAKSVARPDPAAAPAAPKTPAGVAPTAPAETLAGAPPTATPAAPEERPKAEGFIVQLGAFTDSYGANALSNKLKKAGFPAYTEPAETSRGTLWRVRVGGYPSRAAANEARDRLKADGHNGIVSAAK